MKKKINKTAAAIGGSVSTEMPGLPKGFKARRLSGNKLINLSKLPLDETYWGRLVGISTSTKFGTPLMQIDHQDIENNTQSVGASKAVIDALKIEGDKKAGYSSEYMNKLVAFKNNGNKKVAGRKRGFNDIEVLLIDNE